MGKLSKKEMRKLDREYKEKYNVLLIDDLKEYAKNRNKKVRARFVKEGIMIKQEMRGGGSREIRDEYFWNHKNALGKISQRFFMKLVSGLPLDWILYQMILQER